MDSKPVLSIINGVPCREEFRMAEPVTLQIMPGEQVAIVGPNGAGKSRLVDILLGRHPLLNCNQVHYHFEGSPHRYAADNIRVLTFQDSYGSSDATYYLQQRWNQHDIDESTPKVDGKYIISLSSGELRKHQLRQVLASSPRLLIIDNPFIGLDPDARQQLRDSLSELIRQQGLQVILVLSRDKDIPSFITKVINVDKGNRIKERIVSQLMVNDGMAHNGTANDGTANDGMGYQAKELTSSSPILRFSHVTIRYGEHTILRDLSWTVRRGEHWALEGANGSGKSTLLSLVCADNPQAYACDIELFGRQRGTGESIWEIKRHIGYVSPEMHRAYKRDLPAIDIVASGLHDSVGLYVRPRPEQRQVCLEWMRRFGIEHLADRTFMRISSGEQRLCLLARAFVKSPDLLILDEPFHGLDDANRLLATRIIEDYCSDPAITLIIVSHYADELPRGITGHLRLSRQDS